MKTNRFEVSVAAGACASARVAVAGATLALVGALGMLGAKSAAAAQPAAQSASLRTAPVVRASTATGYSAEGVVEAVRSSVIAAQVAGRVTDLAVQAGDHVSAGQVLARIDPSVAADQAASARAQLAQAQAMQDNARADLDRARSLFAQRFLSQAALDRAQTQFQTTEAQAKALKAQAQAAGTQAEFFTVRAPFAGWVQQVQVERGDMAMPGKDMFTVYDPTAMRVSVRVPESVLARVAAKQPVMITLPGSGLAVAAARSTVLPALDADTHSATVRLDLPASVAGVAPGQFARAQFALTKAAPAADAASDSATGSATLRVPAAAVVRRGELTAVYVVDAQGGPRLRQVRLGPQRGDEFDVLAGLNEGERVALDPVAAAQATTAAGAAGMREGAK